MLLYKPTDYDRYVYETEIRDFVPDKIVDCHVHIWEKHETRVKKYNGGSSWTRLVAEELTAEDLLECHKLLMPDKEITPLVFGHCNGPIEDANNTVAASMKPYGFPALYRTSYDIPAEELEKAVIEGGYLGLKPYLTFCPPYIPIPEIRIFDFIPPYQWELANKHGWIVMLHVARDQRLRDKVNVAQLMEIEEKYPNVKLIVAHIGRAYSKEDIGDAFETLKNTKNMVFDFTANMCDDAIRACLEAVGPKRLLFGTDLPIALMRMYRITENGVYYNVVPRGFYGNVSGEPHMRETDEKDITIMYYEQIRAMKRVAEEMKLSKADIEDRFYNNAMRLMGK